LIAVWGIRPAENDLPPAFFLFAQIPTTIATVKRRHFVQAGTWSLFLPSVVISASADARSSDGLAWDYFFFDERFPEARRLAAEWFGITQPTPVLSDVTPIWTGELGRASLTSPLALKGVTTESFYFCLKILLGDQARVAAQVKRVDRDLHLWTMHTDNYPNNGTGSWQNHSRRV